MSLPYGSYLKGDWTWLHPCRAKVFLRGFMIEAFQEFSCQTHLWRVVSYQDGEEHFLSCKCQVWLDGSFVHDMIIHGTWGYHSSTWNSPTSGKDSTTFWDNHIFSQVQTEVKAAVSLWFQSGPTISQNGAKFPRNGSYESDDFDGNLQEAIHVQVTCMIQPLVYNLSLFLNAGLWRLFPVERA